MPWPWAFKTNGLSNSLSLLPFPGLEIIVTDFWALRVKGGFGWKGFTWEGGAPMWEQNICTDRVLLSGCWDKYSGLRPLAGPYSEHHVTQLFKVHCTEARKKSSSVGRQESDHEPGERSSLSLEWSLGVPSVALGRGEGRDKGKPYTALAKSRRNRFQPQFFC